MDKMKACDGAEIAAESPPLEKDSDSNRCDGQENDEPGRHLGRPDDAERVITQ